MKDQKGSVMVETVIVFPIVLMTVFAMLYLSLFKLQQMAMTYQVQRVAHQGAKIAAFPGYTTLGEYKLKNVDFSSDPKDINEYYKAYHQSLKVLYRELFGPESWDASDKTEALMNEVKKSTLILAGGQLIENTVEIKNGFFCTTVTAQSKFAVPMPAAIRILIPDAKSQYTNLQSASATVMNQADFVRIIDLTGDVLTIVNKKLGIDGDVNKIVEGIKKYCF